MEEEKYNNYGFKIFILVLLKINTKMGQSVFIPLYPFETNSRGISKTLVGLIFTTFYLSVFIFALFIPSITKILGKKSTLILGILLDGINICAVGLLTLITNKVAFIVISFIIRTFEGLGAAIISVILFPETLNISKKEDKEKNVGYVQIGSSIGCILGLVFSIFIYRLFGFLATFIITGIIELLGIIFVFFLSFNITQSEESSEQSNKNLFENKERDIGAGFDEENENLIKKDIEKLNKNLSENKECNEENINLIEHNIEKNPSYLEILKNIYILFSFLSNLITRICNSFISPVFSVYLLQTYKIKKEITSFFFLIKAVTYFITVQFFIGIINNKLKEKKSMILGNIVQGIFVFLLAPVKFLPQHISLVIIGLSFIGLAGPLICIPTLIDIVKILKEEIGYTDDDSKYISSSFYTLSLSLGNIIGPAIGGFLTEHFNFHICTYIIGCISLSFGLIFATVYFIDKRKKN